METKDIISLTLSSLAFIITLSNLVITKAQEWRTGQGTIVKALHGDEEAVTYIAYKVKNYRWTKRFRRKKTRIDILTALGLGWTLASCEQTRALIFDTLSEIKAQGYGNEIADILQNVIRQFNHYQSTFNSTNFTDKIQDIKTLMKELQISP